jgi:hydroxyacylglutathione hydrolase
VSVEIICFPCRTDNVGVLIHESGSVVTLAIDAPEETSIKTILSAKNWSLTHILVTHRHPDHIAAIPALRERYGARVLASSLTSEALSHADEVLHDEQAFQIGGMAFTAFATPGHLPDHMAFYSPSLKAAFVGDCLFHLGCGRVADENYEDMHASLSRIAALPDDTQIYCGHDYGLANARFALSLEPDHEALKTHYEQLQILQAQGQLAVPFELAAEKMLNPFLRLEDPRFIQVFDQPVNALPLSTFKALRQRRDKF